MPLTAPALSSLPALAVAIAAAPADAAVGSAALDAVARAGLLTLWQLLLVLGPALAMAAVLHYLSRYVRNRSAGLLGVDAYTYLTAPGVVVHELGHVVFCLLFGHRVVGVRLFRPDPDGTLGRVDHAYNRRNAYQAAGNFFIGTGPIWFGTAVVYALSLALAHPAGAVTAVGTATPAASPAAAATSASATPPAVAGDRPTVPDDPNLAADPAGVVTEAAAAAGQLLANLLRPDVVSTWRFWLFAYLASCIGSHITLSRSDLAGAGRGFLWLVGLLLTANVVALLAFGDQAAAKAAGRVALWGAGVYAAGAVVVALHAAMAVAVAVLASAAGPRRGQRR